MHINKHIYSFGYDKTESELCKLESKYIFNKEEKNKIIFSDIKISPSSSAFIKKRLDVILFSEDYSNLINDIKKENIRTDGFKVEYLVLDGDTTRYTVQLGKLKDVGYSIDTYPDYYNPTITYGICYHEGIWYFGVLIKNNFDWHKHKQKPNSYSSSISITIAKALVNIAASSSKENKLLDACCGVGTIMLEACFGGNNIEGCDINWKVCKSARENLSYFNYNANIYCSDIKDINKRYDAAILDLPYNLYSTVTDNDILHIIKSTAKITDRLVMVSTSDISSLISNAGLTISDYCSISKRGNSKFTRKLWVCVRCETEAKEKL